MLRETVDDGLPVVNSRGLRIFAAAGVPLAVAAWSGGTTLGGQAAFAVAVAILWLVFPPERRPPAALRWVLAGLLAWPLTAFLPPFSMPWPPPAWRQVLGELGLAAGGTWAPQPLAVLEAWLLLAAGLLALLWYLGQDWSEAEAWQAARLYASGAAFLAALALAVFFLRLDVPIWQPRHGIGFFPNRNQMADWLAVAAVLTLALILHDGGMRRVGWSLAFAVLGSAIAVNGSRAGVLLLFVGGGGWLAWFALGSKRRRTARRISLAATGLLLGLAAFLLLGGSTLDRLLPSRLPLTEPEGYARLDVQRDALDFVADNPLRGAGLGHFDAAFAFYNRRLASENRPRHPESDWLWLAAETGLPGLILAAAALVLVARGFFPFDPGSRRGLRVAAALGAACVVLHGFFDVSGHRLGTVLPALLCGSLALHPGAWPLAAAAPWLLRGLAVAVAAALLMDFSGARAHRSLSALAASRLEAREFAAAAGAAEEGLRLRPLDWRLHFTRAAAGVGQGTPLAEIRAAFRTARFLEPRSTKIPLAEAGLLAGRDPASALAAYTEAFQRAPASPAEVLHQAIAALGSRPTARPSLATLALEHPDLRLIWARQASPAEFAAFLPRVLARDPRLAGFNPAQLAQWFEIWSRFQGDEAVARAAAAVPAWRLASAPARARAAAARGFFHEAYEILAPTIPPPALPTGPFPPATEDALRARLALHPDDAAAAFQIYETLRIRGNPGGVLAFLRRAAPGLPPYFTYLHAVAAAHAGEWQEAYEQMQAYSQKTPKP